VTLILKSSPTTFFSGSIVLACLMLLDATMILSASENYLNQIFSIFELCWFLYALLESYQFRKIAINIISPLSYIIYYFFGWCLGQYLLFVNDGILIIPQWYVFVAIIFAIYFLVLNYIEYIKLKK